VEQGYLQKGGKHAKEKAKDDEPGILDTMITSLAELLGDTGVITQEE
jgi:hypothetical protein